MSMLPYKQVNPLRKALESSRMAFVAVGLFSCAINVLMLTGPLFMLQVYDRVLASGSVPTLVALFGLVTGLYLFMGLFDFIRTRILSRIGYRLDVELSGLSNKAWIQSRLVDTKQKTNPVTDLSAIRQFVCSNGLPALFDLPWVPFYLAIVYLLHVWLGLLATAGAIIVIVATILSEWITKSPIKEASLWEYQDARFSSNANRNAESILSMGMAQNVGQHWENIRHHALAGSQSAAARAETLNSVAKATRMLIQSGILALGAYLAIKQEITPGTMIGASILGGRALTPIDAALANWKNFVKARQAYTRLSGYLASVLASPPPLKLPVPKGNLVVSNLLKLPHGYLARNTEQKPILSGIGFRMAPGDGLGVIGPSASGKSSLARLLVGLWMPDKGSIRLDGATFDQWDKDHLGRYIGYLPQSVELLEGTIRQNIARFDATISDGEIIEAARLAGVHELVLNLPEGYSTNLATNMHLLSGGQIQRIALARAVLRTPPLVVLDEPNSNLDVDGDAALTRAIQTLRESGSCVIVMAHRPSAISAVNKLLMLDRGQQIEFGDKEDVLRKVTRPIPNLKVMSEGIHGI